MKTRSLLAPLGVLVLAACSSAPAGPSAAWTQAPPAPAGDAEVVVEVYKSPTCACCHEWEAYMRAHGYTIHSIPTEDMAGIKTAHGMPQAAWSCHTAVIAGYVVEGHVPVAAIEDLLAERPTIDGIALPAMPPGSPGMSGVKERPFEVLAVDGGATTGFGSY